MNSTDDFPVEDMDLGVAVSVTELQRQLNDSLKQLEDQCQEGLLGDAALGLVGSETHSGKGGLNGIGGTNMRPVLSREVIPIKAETMKA